MRSKKCRVFKSSNSARALRQEFSMDSEIIMYTRMLIPLDGSKVAEQVLPYARCLAKALAIPVELLEIIDLEALNVLARPEEGRYIDTLVDEKTQTSKSYLQAIARSFESVDVNCMVENGKAEERVIERAAADKDTLIVMATHGRSGIQRWLLGSVADKVLQRSNESYASRPGKRCGEG